MNDDSKAGGGQSGGINISGGNFSVTGDLVGRDMRKQLAEWREEDKAKGQGASGIG